MDLAGNETNSIGFLLRVWRLAALFPFDWSIKSALPLSNPLQKVISRAKLFALRCLLRGIPSPLWRSQAEGERVGNISSRFIERSINRSLLPLTLLTPADPWTSCYPAGQTGVKTGGADTKTETAILSSLVCLYWFTFCPTSHSRICETQHPNNFLLSLNTSLYF